MVTINSYPRIHFSLLDFSPNGYRSYGGAGIAIDTNPLIVTFEASNYVDLSLLKLKEYFDAQEVFRLEAKFSSIFDKNKLRTRPKLVAIDGVYRHIGLGSGTRLALSISEAAYELNNIPYTRSDIQRTSGRGGASGIGIHAYFQGGLVLDIGKPRSSQLFESSDVQEFPNALPQVAVNAAMPMWNMALVIPKAFSPISLDVENSFFATNTPIESSTVYEATYLSLFGIVGGSMSGDYSAFCSSLKRLQELTWKKAEWSLHGEEMANLRAQLYDCGVDVVAMSSFGPALLCLGSKDSLNRLKSIESVDIYLTRCRNQGRELYVS